MSNVQKIVLVVGAALTIYFLAFAPFTYDKTVTNPKYAPPNGTRWSSYEPRYITEQITDYRKRLSFAGASILGTGVLFFVVKPKREEEDGQSFESD